VLFCGYWRDGDTELDHVRRRFYHPTLGRWLTRDPLGYIDGMSLYEYVGSLPLSAVDPYGLAKGFWNKIKEAVGGVWSLGPRDAYRAAKGDIAEFAHKLAVEVAAEKMDTEKKKDKGKDNDKKRKNDLTNAVRHAAWSAKLTQEFGEDKAKRIADLHELGEEDTNDSIADQHNNKIGREIGKKAKNDEDIRRLAKQALENGDLIVDRKNDPRIPKTAQPAATDSSSSSDSSSDSSSNLDSRDASSRTDSSASNAEPTP